VYCCSWQPPKTIKYTEVRPCPVPLVERPEYKEGEQVEVGVLNVADVVLI